MSQEPRGVEDFLHNIKVIFEPKTQHRNLKFRQAIASDLPVVVHGDEQKLNQILLNLIIEALKNVKVIIISASAFSHNRAECEQAGADDFLPKPFRHEQLLEALGAHLRLTWIYEREVEAGALKTSLVAPGDEEMTMLMEFAKRGDIKHILEQADRLERGDASYARFAAELRQLASRFQVKKIGEFLAEVKPRE